MWRRLGAELRRIREQEGLPQSAILSRQPTVSDIEQGHRMPTEDQLRGWLAFADERETDLVWALYAAAQSEVRVWASVLAEDPTGQRTASADEAPSRRIRVWQNRVIPGLLQTPAYARAVFEALGRQDVDTSVAERMTRQEILLDSGRSFQFLISEHLLGCAVAPHARSDQLWQLALAAARLGTVLGVVPDHVLTPEEFMIFEPLETEPYVAMETVLGLGRLRSPVSVAAYESEWARLFASAWTGPAAVERIRAQPGWGGE